jgi:hypothetical protein
MKGLLGSNEEAVQVQSRDQHEMSLFPPRFEDSQGL